MNVNELKALIVSKRQFLLYCVIGFSGVGLDFAVYSLLLNTGKLEYQVANAIGYSAGTLLSFTLNARFNYKVNDRLLARFASFAFVSFLGWATSYGLLHLLVEHFGVNKYLAKAASLVVVVMLQYNLNRLISFRKTA